MEMKLDLHLVDCKYEYWEFVRLLRNDPRVSDGFIETKYIFVSDQQKYMSKWADNYKIAILGGQPVGYIGVIDDDIRVCTHPDFQGKGIGKFMINEIMHLFPNAKAKVKLHNESSIKLFESCGFKKKYYLMER
jgi:ribosomal protein S18 acetylase RimI-like enzyme